MAQQHTRHIYSTGIEASHAERCSPSKDGRRRHPPGNPRRCYAGGGGAEAVGLLSERGPPQVTVPGNREFHEGGASCPRRPASRIGCCPSRPPYTSPSNSPIAPGSSPSARVSARRRASAPSRPATLEVLDREIAAARRRFTLDASVPLISCYEAGRDGFWLHRFLQSRPDRSNLVVDSASIDVKRRHRRLKTDRIDVLKLLAMLMRYHNGEVDVWSVVHVPSPEAEDARHLHRELLTLKAERTRVTNRIKGLLAAQGLSVSSLARGLPEQLDVLRLWDGSPLPPRLHERLLREWHHRNRIVERVRLIERLQTEQLQDDSNPAISMVRQLMTLKGIGLQSAWLFTFEFFAWRGIQSRKQITALSGLAPSPYQSGDEARDLGISKAGSSSVRAMAIQIG